MLPDMPRPALRLALALLSLLAAAASARAQTPPPTLEATISVSSVEPPRLRVEGVRASASKSWSLPNSYAGATGLAARVENLALADAEGRPVPARQLAPGEYTAERDATRFSYELKLDPPALSNDAAHVSWLTPQRGLLQPADLLPVPHREARLRLSLPAGWQVSTTETAGAGGVYQLADAGKAVFLVGRDLRTRGARRGGMDYATVTAGEWAFTDEELAGAVGEILKDYEEMSGGVPFARASVLVLPFPREASAQVWSAETRGSTVVILSGRWPSKTLALSRLDGVLSHELLHLWVPNGLALEGEYDWFYEGFTLYQAMRRGVRRGQLTFQDFLAALGRAYDGYRGTRSAQEVSLVEASRRRWTLPSSYVYDKGLVVAFLYDLALAQRTGGKSSLDELYRTLFRRHGPKGARAEGNSAVSAALGRAAGMEAFAGRYVGGASAIDLAAELAPYGLRLEPLGSRTRILVSDSLTRPQRELLRKFGYNEPAAGGHRRD